MATFLVGSASNVRPLGPLPAGPVCPSGPCCLGVAAAPFLSSSQQYAGSSSSQHWMDWIGFDF